MTPVAFIVLLILPSLILHYVKINNDIEGMQLALKQAELGLYITSPNPRVGCVIVKEGMVVAQGHTQAAGQAHAEVSALSDATVRGVDVRGATAYVTLEPCCMCVGAILHARIARVFFGAADAKTGACGSVVNLFSEARLNHHAEVNGGLMADESVRLLKEFFAQRRG